MRSFEETFSDETYLEDWFTLQWMTEYFDFPVELIRKIQKLGLMLPGIVKFGSVEIEIYSGLDQTMFRRFTETLDEGGDFSKAVAEAEAFIADIYRVAHGEAPLPMNDSLESGPLERTLRRMNGLPESGGLGRRLRRRKLLAKQELCEALGISEEHFEELREAYLTSTLSLRIPGTTIEYYIEDDYLSLRYFLTLLAQGHSLEAAADQVFDWTMYDLRGCPRFCSPDTCPLLKKGASTEKV